MTVQWQAFVQIFNDEWPGWADTSRIMNAWKQVGISVSGLDPDAIPDEKLGVSHQYVEESEPEATPQSQFSSTPSYDVVSYTLINTAIFAGNGLKHVLITHTVAGAIPGRPIATTGQPYPPTPAAT